METATYDSSQGHASGGFVNTSLKSGTEAFRGGAFAYYQNPAANANNWTLSTTPGQYQAAMAETGRNDWRSNSADPEESVLLCRL